MLLIILCILSIFAGYHDMALAHIHLESFSLPFPPIPSILCQPRLRIRLLYVISSRLLFLFPFLSFCRRLRIVCFERREIVCVGGWVRREMAREDEAPTPHPTVPASATFSRRPHLRLLRAPSLPAFSAMISAAAAHMAVVCGDWSHSSKRMSTCCT